jgi:xanthine/CO dehydrogenase XdhC/CoxF family maturation factor
VWGLGLGCHGDVVVLLERLVPGRHPDALRFLRACVRERRSGVLATLFRIEGAVEACVGDRLMLNADGAALSSIGDPELRRALERDAREVLASGRTTVREYALANGSAEICLEHVAPPTALQVFGAGEDALPVVRLALALGFTVAVADSREAKVSAGRFPGAHDVRCIDFDRLDAARLLIDRGTAVLVMTHHFLYDLALLRFLLGTPAFYVGFLGPAQRWRNLLQELDRHRLHGPVGLDIGAETPEEIALSVLAEIRAVAAGRPGGFLRDRPGPLHDP